MKDERVTDRLDTNVGDTKPIVLVEWHDARYYPDTRAEKDIESCRMALFATVGYLIRQDSITTVIVAERNDEDEYREITLIPTGSIKSMRRLALGSPMLESERLIGHESVV